VKVRAWQGGGGGVPESLEAPLWTIAMNLDGNFRFIYVFCPSESICSVRFWSSDLYLLVLTASSRAEFGFFNFETSAHFTPGRLWFAENNFLCFSNILREIWENFFFFLNRPEFHRSGPNFVIFSTIFHIWVKGKIMSWSYTTVQFLTCSNFYRGSLSAHLTGY